MTGQPKELKRVNTSLVLESIRKRKDSTRADILNDTGISHTTVRSILAELLEAKEIISLGLDKSTGGRRAERYALNTNRNYILSLYIEETLLIYNMVNILGKTIEEGKRQIKKSFDQEALDKLLDSLILKYKDISIIGISVPGIVQKDGFLSGKSSDSLQLININEYIEKKYNISVVLENDLNAIAIGFYKEYKEKVRSEGLNMVYIHFSTLGAGAGIIVNGQIVRGKDNFSGEIGFMPIENTYVNECLFQELTDEAYCSFVSKIITILTCIINPQLVVVGGNYFKYDLLDRIKEKKYNKTNKVTSDLIAIQDSSKYSMNGIKELAMDFINEDVKLIDGKMINK